MTITMCVCAFSTTRGHVKGNISLGERERRAAGRVGQGGSYDGNKSAV